MKVAPESASSRAAATAQSARNRQIIYALAIVFIFGALWPYNAWLGELKRQKDLGEATIGQVDAGSLMLKLAMIGGFRGVAANVLWMRANDLQKAHEWDKLRGTVDLITKLQPHFLTIWTFQGWNLAYNVSVEWDAPEDKYTWIKQGINFLKQGVEKNSKSPDLIWDTAWTYYHKLGMADEAIILRRLLYDDPDDDGSNFKTDPLTGDTRNDNFQLAYGWFTRSIRKVDEEGARRVDTAFEAPVEYVDKPIQRKGRAGDLAFRSMPSHAQTRYAISLEKQSMRDIPATFGQIAMDEWERAYREWLDFGRTPFPAYNKPEQIIYIDDHTDVKKYEALDDNAQLWTRQWSSQMNYPYWKDRAAAEKTRQGVQARRLFYEGTLALKQADFPAAAAKFREGLDLWKVLLDSHNSYRNDELNKKDTGFLVKRYVFALKQMGQEPPADMPFQDLYEAVKNEKMLDPFDQLDMMRSKTPTNSGAESATPR
jgi:hypothetical protein